MNIHILKTDVSSPEQVEHALNEHPLIEEWSVDLEDCDRVLRAVTLDLPEAELIALLLKHGVCGENLQA